MQNATQRHMTRAIEAISTAIRPQKRRPGKGKKPSGGDKEIPEI